MQLIVDLHVHSYYSRATSKDCNLENLYYWGKLKGINIIGTGDFTHPAWFTEIADKLQPAEPGLYRLRPDIADAIDKTLPRTVRSNLIRFVPTVEIATIYKKHGKIRKLHQLVVAPSLESVASINAKLQLIGNLAADGRPILGLDSKELLRIVLQQNPDVLYIPAHIWTPWFGMFGSKSGFDSVQQAFDELAPHITTVESGLSSDPAMNRRVADLDKIAITSHSDAHSPQKLGREATVLQADLNYDDIIGALKTNDARLAGTIEFFPEEGKYYADGHRACDICFTPDQTVAAGGICPRCQKPLVVGVQNRLSKLASRPDEYTPSQAKQVEYIVPLAEIMAQILGVKSVTAKKVQAQYHSILAEFGDEFSVLRTVPTDAIEQVGFVQLAQAIKRMRSGLVMRQVGYDGVYGIINVLAE